MAQDIPPDIPVGPADIPLRILHTTDLHGALRGFDYLTDCSSETTGLTRLATLIRTARDTARNVLLFDTGDFLQGSAVCDLAAESGLRPGQVHPMIAAMNALGYDAAAPGNHDFNHGIGFLVRALADAGFPVVSANFLHRFGAAAGPPVFAPTAMLERPMLDRAGRLHTLRIAVIGCLPPQTIMWDHALAADFTTDCMLHSVRRTLKSLRTQPRDLTVLLAHSGLDPKAPPHFAENALLDLAALDGIDVVLGGHCHAVFPELPAPEPKLHPAIDHDTGRLHGKPASLAGAGGSHLGRIDLVLRTCGTAGRTPIHISTTAIPLVERDPSGRITRTTAEDPALLEATNRVHRATRRHLGTPLGITSGALHSFFSLLSNDAMTALVARSQSDFLRRTIAGTSLADLPLLSAAAPFKTGGIGGPGHYTHVEAGPLTLRSVIDLYAYPNTICALRITGAQLRDLLEHSASRFRHVPAGATPDLPLLDDSFPGYTFDTVFGLTYRIDLSQPPRYDSRRDLANPGARRIRDMRYLGAPVDDDRPFLMAANSYRVYGTGFTGPAPEIVFEARDDVRGILRDFLRRQGRIEAVAKPVWSFLPLGGATALFDTSPLARRYLDDPLLPPLQDLGDTPRGFARFRVTL